MYFLISLVFLPLILLRLIFLKTQSKDIANMLSILGQRELLKDMKELDPDRRELYHNTLESISE